MARNVLFLQGTLDNFNAITAKDPNTFYHVDGTDLYLGDKKLTNAPEIEAAVKRVAANESAISKLQEDLEALTGNGESGGSISELLAALKTELKGYADQKVKDETERAQLAEGNLETSITNLTTTVNENKTEIEGKVSDLTGVVNGHTTDIAKNASDITTLNGRVSQSVTNLETSIGAVNTRVDGLLGEDKSEEGAAPTIREIAEDAASKKVNAIVDNAPESFDTLKEIADWITNDETGAASISATVGEHTKEINTLKGNVSTLRTDVNNNDIDIKALQDADVELDRRLDTAEGQLALVDGKIEAAEEAAKTHATNLDTAMGQRVDAVEGRLNTAESSITGHGERLTAVEQKAADNAASITTHTTQIGNAQQAIQTLQNAVNGYGDIVSKNWSDVTSAVSTAKNEAITYTDSALTWNPIVSA